MDTNELSTIPNLSEDISEDVTFTTSESTEVKETTEESGDTSEERKLSRDVTESESEELESERDPERDDAARRSYEVTRREVELGFTEGGADYLLNLDTSKMSKERRSEIDAAVKHFWGDPSNGGAKNLEQAREIIKKAKESSDDIEQDVKAKDIDIDELVERKVQEKLQAKETDAKRIERESLEKEQLSAFIEANDFLKPENDPGKKNWDIFDAMFVKFDASGDVFSFEEKLQMSLNKAFGDDLDSIPSQNLGNVPITSTTSISTAPQKGLKDSKYLDFLPSSSRENLKKAGRL